MSQPYPFDPEFEKTIVVLMVTSAQFFGRVGPHIEPDRFKDTKAQIIGAQCRALYERSGKPPGSLSVLLQLLRKEHDRGKLNRAKLGVCTDYLLDALDREDTPDPDVVAAEVAEVLQRDKHQEALEDAMTTYAERGDMTEVARKIEKVSAIGKVDVSYGLGLDSLADDLEAAGQQERMSTGFLDIDSEMGGGVARGEFWFWLAGPKTGKSMALVQNAVIMLLKGLHVCVATLELNENQWRARVIGAITGTPYQDILKYGRKSVAFARYAELVNDPDINLGRLSVKKFPGHQTPVTTAFDWVHREEDRSGVGCDAFIADYCDKFTGKNTKDDMYLQMRDVYESTRLWCENGNRWGWSASQAVRIELGEMPTINSCADSQHKVRVTDGMIGIARYPEEENKVGAKVLALRNGTGDGATAGPLPNGFDYGCFVKNCVPGIQVEEALVN